MAVAVQESADGKIIEIRLSGKLSKEDYEHFVPVLEQRIREQGKIRLLVEMHDFHGWELAALWEDLRFDIKHFSDIARLAMIGESKWQKGMAAFCKPFTSAKLQYFEPDQAAEARQWLAAEG